MDRLRLLTTPLETLTLAERAVALLEARRHGRGSAERVQDARELEDAPLVCWTRYVVEPAEAAGQADGAARAAWAEAVRTEQALRDPRVQAFFFGWHERATELLAEIAGDGGEDDRAARARWFLDALDRDSRRG